MKLLLCLQNSRCFGSCFINLIIVIDKRIWDLDIQNDWWNLDKQNANSQSHIVDDVNNNDCWTVNKHERKISETHQTTFFLPRLKRQLPKIYF